MRKGLLIVCIVATGITTIVLKDFWYNTDEDQQVSKWGTSFNSERLKRNIPPVEKHWIKHGNDSSTVYWSNKKNTIDRLEPFHFYKTVELKGENIRSEKDAFHYEYSDSYHIGL